MKFGVQKSCIVPDYMQVRQIVSEYGKVSPAIIDFKTTRKPKKREWIDDYFLQGSLYSVPNIMNYMEQILRLL